MGDPASTSATTKPATTTAPATDATQAVSDFLMGASGVLASMAKNMQAQNAQMNQMTALARSVAANVFDIKTSGKEVNQESLATLGTQIANLSLEDFVKLHKTFGELEGPDGKKLGSMGAVLQSKNLYQQATNTISLPQERKRAEVALTRIVDTLYPAKHYNPIHDQPNVVEEELVSALNGGLTNSPRQRILKVVSQIFEALEVANTAPPEQHQTALSSASGNVPAPGNAVVNGIPIRTRTIIQLPPVKPPQPAVTQNGPAGQSQTEEMQNGAAPPAMQMSVAEQLNQELQALVYGPTPVPRISKDGLEAAHEGEQLRFERLAQRARELYAAGRIDIGFDDKNMLYFVDLPPPHQVPSKDDMKFFKKQMESQEDIMKDGRHEVDEDRAGQMEDGQDRRGYRGGRFDFRIFSRGYRGWGRRWR